MKEKNSPTSTLPERMGRWLKAPLGHIARVALPWSRKWPIRFSRNHIALTTGHVIRLGGNLRKGAEAEPLQG